MTQSLRAIRMEGVISVIGLLTGAQPKDNIMETLSRVCTVRGVYVGSREQLEEMVKFMEEHEIHPVMDKTVFTLDTVKEAYEYMVSVLLVGSAEGNADKQTVGAEALWKGRYHDRVVCWIWRLICVCCDDRMVGHVLVRKAPVAEQGVTHIVRFDRKHVVRNEKMTAAVKFRQVQW